MNMEYNILKNIKSPADVKKLPMEQLDLLAKEIRYKMIETVSQNGGHLASNLGTVELTIALHRVFNSPQDQIVFDVGHQCYTHKLLTGRYDKFSSLRKKDGISGFCRPNESEHDILYSGHSSTSISAGLGLATAKKLSKEKGNVISVIGDGSFTGGMVYEALNNGGRSGIKHIIILNDNKMSISENVGAFAKYLAIIRSKPKYYTFKAATEHRLNTIPGVGSSIVSQLYKIKTDLKNKIYSSSTFFEDLGYRYMGPIDGHNIHVLCDALEVAKKIDVPVLLHVCTTKGKGYDFAEKSPSLFHGISSFDIDTGESVNSGESFCSCFGKYLCTLAAEDDRICAVTAAMSIGTGLENFSKQYPSRFFDVGIAEEHAVTFTSGLARNNMKPVFAVYSTFFQRCYDQLVHDISLQKLKVVFAVDRAGFVGEDGETHHGLMDVPFVNTIPNIEVYSPCSFEALEKDLKKAFFTDNYSTVVRYPRGCEDDETNKLQAINDDFFVYGDKNSKRIIVTYGRISGQAVRTVDELKKDGEKIYLLSLDKVKPIPQDAIKIIAEKSEVFFFEEGLRSGGVGEHVALILLENNFKGKFYLTAVNDEFVGQAKVDELLAQYKLDKAGMIEIISSHASKEL